MASIVFGATYRGICATSPKASARPRLPRPRLSATQDNKATQEFSKTTKSSKATEEVSKAAETSKATEASKGTMVVNKDKQ